MEEDLQILCVVVLTLRSPECVDFLCRQELCALQMTTLKDLFRDCEVCS